jgi:hypothetical protein
MLLTGEKIMTVQRVTSVFNFQFELANALRLAGPVLVFMLPEILRENGGSDLFSQIAEFQAPRRYSPSLSIVSGPLTPDSEPSECVVVSDGGSGTGRASTRECERSWPETACCPSVSKLAEMIDMMGARHG